MMIKFHVWTKLILTFFRTVSVYQILILNVESFNFKCPSQNHWKFRAQIKCNSTLTYYCLYNNIEGKYVEGCNGPDWDRKGSKRIYAGDFTRGFCKEERFQPFKFWTNGSTSDCIYAKSICSEDGQIVYVDNSAKDDRTCRCDYNRNYSFIKIPRQLCYCIPAEEDCSCYINICPVNFTLSADYECIPSNSQEKPKCFEITRYSETKDDNKSVLVQKEHLSETSSNIKLSVKAAGTIVIFLCFIHIIGVCCLVLLFENWTRDRLQTFRRYLRRRQTANDSMIARTQPVENLMHQPTNISDCTGDERPFLQMVHLLFRVACPVVRLVFNHEIKPDQLRKTLDQNKLDMEKRYRKKEAFINDVQWDLLFKGNTVNSDDFDIRLMIYLLRSLTNIAVGDLYPVSVDKSIGAQLSRIKFIRNEVTQTFGQTLPDGQFIEYLDDTEEAILKLVSSHIHAIANDDSKSILNERLLRLNPINIDQKALCLFIWMSDKYPAMILHQIILENCKIQNLTIEDILRNEKHDLYHKRIKTDSCCMCPEELSSFMKAIPEKQWEALYEMKEDSSNSHSCDLKKCSYKFIPKEIDKFDLSVSLTIILNIPSFLEHIIKRLCAKGFKKFLVNYKHAIFHSAEKQTCCQYIQVPTEKRVLKTTEVEKLYRKQENISCQRGNTDCCCQYSARKGIKYSKMDEVFWSRLFYTAGPLSVLYRTEQDAFSYYLNWTVDEQPFRKVLKDLLKMVKDKEFRHRMRKRINESQFDETTPENIDANNKWVSTHLRHVRDNKTVAEQQTQIIVRSEDGLKVKSVQIPKGFTLPNRTRVFKDLTSEENNFLVVFHGITKIVYPVIQKEFDTQCPKDVLQNICMGIYYEKISKDECNDKQNGRKKRINLSQKQREQLFSPKKMSKNLDLKLMIYILKLKLEDKEKKDFVDQLDKIRRKIVQSSSGILDEETFKNIMKTIHKAVLHLGGEMYEEKLLQLQYIKNILE